MGRPHNAFNMARPRKHVVLGCLINKIYQGKIYKMLGKEIISRYIVVVIVFVVCSIVFLYKSGECFYKFSLHETVTKLDVVSPQNYPELPLPKVCIRLGFNTKVLESLNITIDEYRHGVWRNEQNKSENEEEVYNRVANDYSDVIDTITMRVNSGDGDSYRKVTIYENGTDMSCLLYTSDAADE